MRKPRFELFLFLLSLGVLLVCGYYAALRISHPISRIPWEPSNWVVRFDQLDCVADEPCLQVGDHVLEVNGVSFEDFHNDRTRTVLTGEPPFEILFRRRGRLDAHLAARRILVFRLPLVAGASVRPPCRCSSG